MPSMYQDRCSPQSHSAQGFCFESELWQHAMLTGADWVVLGWQVYNPATNQVVANVPVGGAKETSRAISAAADAFPAWKAKTAKERGTILRKCAILAPQDLSIANKCGLAPSWNVAECTRAATSLALEHTALPCSFAA